MVGGSFAGLVEAGFSRVGQVSLAWHLSCLHGVMIRCTSHVWIFGFLGSIQVIIFCFVLWR